MKRIKETEEKLNSLFSSLGLKTGPIYCYDSVRSTMDVAFDMDEDDIKDKTIIIAQRQKRGRGRHGRKWYSAHGSLLFSLVLNQYDIRLPYSIIASFALYKTFNHHTQKVRLKWINDIMWENGKKVAGILTEERLKRMVIGMGINLNDHSIPRQVEPVATSYYIETGERLDRDQFLVSIIDEFLSLLTKTEKGSIEEILTAWENEAGIRNRSVRVIDGKREIQGTALGIDKKTGALKIRIGKDQVEVYEGTLFYT
ncbi:MAG: biotin--[acetyl-CoA-carboxylase] ligase [Spirochaetota bacterium]|nr:MAG: biotin--[acetyl-CoA-carboxylase] ligase [Spirochaetota bacterium]